MGALIAWWLASEVVGLAALPLIVTLFGNLPDRGWAFAKPAGMLLLGWLIWLPLAAIAALPYSRGWIIGAFLVFAAGNVALARRPGMRATLRRLLTEHRGYLLAGEVIYAVAFFGMAWLRSFTAAVVDTEKFMDMAFLSSLWRTPHLPAPDPWLSGQPINYYYFGHYLLATLAKTLGTEPGTAFNIGIALIFALAAVALFGAGANLYAAVRGRGNIGTRRAIVAGLASAVLVLVLGNLNGAQVWWQEANALVGQAPQQLSSPWGWWLHRELWTQYFWWGPSRLVPNTINEFPAFSFVLADLHAHVLALPFAAVAAGLAFNLLLARGEGLRVFGQGLDGVLSLVASAVLLGGLYALNGWDLPTYLGLALVALALQQWLTHGRRLSLLFALDLFSAGVMLVAFCFLFYLPFYRGFVSPSQGIVAVAPADRSAIGYEVAIFGLPVFLLGSLLVVRLARWVSTALSARVHNTPTADGAAEPVAPFGARQLLAEHAGLAGAALIVVPLGLLALWTAGTQRNLGWTLFWSLLLLGACAALVLRQLVLTPGREDARQSEEPHAVTEAAELWVFVLLGTAMALVAAAELVYLRDIFGIRMNTVFKLYYQAWLLLGLAAGPALMWLVSASWRPLAEAVATMPFPRVARGGRQSLGAAALVAGTGAQPALPLGTRLFMGASGVTSRARTDRTESDLIGGEPGSAYLPSPLRWLRAGGILLWMGVLIVLVAAALIYPVLAASARTQNFSLPTGMDGTAYMATDSVHAPATCTVGGGSNAHDDAAIRWLNSHVSGSPVILEAPGCEWSRFSRVSAFTGLPTLLGWPGGHEGEWRANWLAEHDPQIFAERADTINTIYTSGDSATVMDLLRRYSVRYVYVGVAERALYPGADLSRFGQLLRVVYDSGGVTIYEVP